MLCAREENQIYISTNHNISIPNIVFQPLSPGAKAEDSKLSAEVEIVATLSAGDTVPLQLLSLAALAATDSNDTEEYGWVPGKLYLWALKSELHIICTYCEMVFFF